MKQLLIAGSFLIISFAAQAQNKNNTSCGYSGVQAQIIF
jgi:hypothetical protein